MGRLGDCEQVVAGFVGQPANTFSSLVYIVAALVVAARAERDRAALLTSGGLVLVGVGSFLFHGPGGSAAEVLHAVSIAALLSAVLLAEVTRRRSGSSFWWLVAFGALIALAGFWREAEPAVQLILVVAILLLVAGPNRTRRLLGPAALLTGALAVFALSRTEAPWCSPDSVFQGHAVWHVLSAVAVGWYALQRLESQPAEAG